MYNPGRGRYEEREEQKPPQDQNGPRCGDGDTESHFWEDRSLGLRVQEACKRETLKGEDKLS